MTRKRLFAGTLAVNVGIVASIVVGATAGPDPIQFWAVELCLLLTPGVVPDALTWRLAEGVTVALLTLPGLLLALVVFAKARGVVHQSPDRCQACGYDLTGNLSGTCPECGGKA